MTTTFADPLRLATVCLSLLRDEAYDAVLGLSSEFVKDRYMLYGGRIASPADALRLLTWQQDRVQSVLESTDVALEPLAPGSALYRVWDEETVQAAVPFGLPAAEALAVVRAAAAAAAAPSAGPGDVIVADSLAAKQGTGGACGVVVLLLHSPGRWVLHNLVEAPHGWATFARGWFPDISQARAAFARASAAAPSSAAPALLGSMGDDDREDAEYWNSYNVVGENTPVYPLFGIMAFAMGGATFFLTHLARHPEVVWSRRNNPQPYQSVKQNETTKLYNPNGTFERTWSRNAL
ncbi:hypothetical protein HK105_202663 [Polyrhizophydium stewartii]|uniref:Uncharacterized protein n=1 Tax=Polyrhizophydium stewartii TaxID=2732419 RepID=A0ABR4NE57_9FUNG|nr:hypothetical protein HK105_006469 [Polyrhizophydium stewartii]